MLYSQFTRNINRMCYFIRYVIKEKANYKKDKTDLIYYNA